MCKGLSLQWGMRMQGVLGQRCEKNTTCAALQGVHAVFDGTPGKPWREGDRHRSRMVFIGRDLDEGLLRAGFAKCLA